MVIRHQARLQLPYFVAVMAFLIGCLLLSACGAVSPGQSGTSGIPPQLPHPPGFDLILTLDAIPPADVFGEAPPDCQRSLTASALGTQRSEAFETYKRALDTAGWTRLGGHETVATFWRGTSEWVEVTEERVWEKYYEQHEVYISAKSSRLEKTHIVRTLNANSLSEHDNPFTAILGAAALIGLTVAADKHRVDTIAQGVRQGLHDD